MKSFTTSLEDFNYYFWAANIALSKKGYKFLAKNFRSDKGNVDFVLRDIKRGKISFVILVENKNKDFKKREDWQEIIKKRHIGYTVDWFLRKHKIDSEYRLDIIECYKKGTKVKFKHYIEVLYDFKKDN